MKNRVPLAVGLDVFVVVAFVAIGRRNHDEHPGLVGLVQTTAPFLIGLALGWAAVRAWRDPDSLTAGVAVWVVTVAAGMLARRFLFGEGTAASFVVVATIFLGAFLNGWRAIARTVASRRARADVPATRR
jgi:MFS-type transporter involved in bile tolerance (Atg22 family)